MKLPFFKTLSFFFLAAWMLSPLSAQIIASNSATGLSYATIQAAINAATNSYTVFVYSNTVGAIQIYNKTNMVLTRAAAAAGIPEIKDTSLGATTYGVDIQGCKGVTISNLTVAEFYNGISFGGNDYNCQILGCWVRSNTASGLSANGATVASNLIASNTITAPGANYAIYFDNGAFSNRILSNRVSGPVNALVLGSVGGCPGNTIAWNDISGIQYTAVNINQASFRTMVTSNVINYGSANSVGVSINSSKAYSNYVISNRILNQWQGIYAYSSNFIFNNEISGYTSFGIALVGGAVGTNNVIVSNLIRNGNGSAIEMYGSASGNLILSNRIVSNSGSLDMVSISSVNGNVVANNFIAENSGNGVHIGSTTGNVVTYNTLISNGTWNITGTGSGGFFSNYFGPANRAFSTKAANTGVSGTYTQWLNGPIGSNGDFVVPAALTATLATNGLPGQVVVHWGPNSPSPDFSCYKIFRTQVSNNYSNLVDSDVVQTITSAATTNFIDTPQAGGNTFYYVTVVDTNGNESWYSPQSTVTYTSNDPPVASFTGPSLWMTNQTASFTSTSWVGTDPITNYLWRFGDGTSVIGSNVSINHVYSMVVTNFVSLTVWNSRGQSNTASNAIAVTGFNQVSGVVSGQITNGVSMSLTSPNVNLTTNTAGLGQFSFWVTNDSYMVQPIRLGYRFAPGSRSVVINYNDSTNNTFTATEIYPTLAFSNLTDGDKIKRDLSLQVTSDAPEILSTVTYTLSNLSPTNHYNAVFNAAYGTPVVFDSTLREDGDYRIQARAVDTVFGRTHSNQMTVTFDNGLFKVLDKNLENLKAIAYDTIRHPSKNETLEFFFYIKDTQNVRIDLYSKTGRPVLSWGDKSYGHGHNRLALDLPITLPSGPYYAVFECREFSKTVLFVVSQ